MPRRHGGRSGIIPARAGFTKWSYCRVFARKDHPRSRGVYAKDVGVHRERDGSSPLARGLRADLAAVAYVLRIIPARAGFTGIRQGVHEEKPDHPRSRGVYTPSHSASHHAPGSSPLARGLRGPSRHPSRHGGIIPARAGFTHSAGLIPSVKEDHPRSRGVYATSTVRLSPDRGSSPLARGLHQSATTCTAAWRIIPARAGFTDTAKTLSGLSGDHPRSRGVYRLTASRYLRTSGSSPLARGLLIPTRVPGGVVRIIPARAGFTC